MQREGCGRKWEKFLQSATHEKSKLEFGNERYAPSLRSGKCSRDTQDVWVYVAKASSSIGSAFMGGCI